MVSRPRSSKEIEGIWLAGLLACFLACCSLAGLWAALGRETPKNTCPRGAGNPKKKNLLEPARTGRPARFVLIPYQNPGREPKKNYPHREPPQKNPLTLYCVSQGWHCTPRGALLYPTGPIHIPQRFTLYIMGTIFYPFGGCIPHRGPLYTTGAAL